MTLPFKVEYSRRPQTKMIDYVLVDGEEYELHDLLNMLQETRDGNIQITSGIDHFKKLAIVEKQGSQRHLEGASLGSQGIPFIEELERQEELLDAENEDGPTAYETMLRDAWEEGMYTMTDIQTEKEDMPQYYPDNETVEEAWLKSDQKKLADKIKP